MLICLPHLEKVGALTLRTRRGPDETHALVTWRTQVSVAWEELEKEIEACPDCEVDLSQ